MNRHWKLILLSFLMSTAGCNTTQRSSAKMDAQNRWNTVRASVKHQLAEQQYEGGLFDQAAETITESIGLDPTRADAYALLTQANLELGKPASAWQILEAAARAGVRSTDIIYLEGVLLELQEKPEPALDKFAEARALDPGNVDCLVAQVECLVNLNRTQEAMTLLKEVGGGLDDDATVPVLTAHVASLLGDTTEASRRYRQAMVAGSTNRLVAQELGMLLVRAGRYEEALAVLSPVVESAADPETCGATRRALAICHLAMRDPKASERVLVDYARHHPEDTLAQLLLAKSALATGDTLTALRAVNLLEQREPDHPELWIVRATLRWKRGDLAGAATDLYDVLTNDPDDLDAHCLLAEVLRGRQQHGAARNHFEQALEIDPHCAWAAAGLKSIMDAKPTDADRPSIRLTSDIEPAAAPETKAEQGTETPTDASPAITNPDEEP